MRTARLRRSSLARDYLLKFADDFRREHMNSAGSEPFHRCELIHRRLGPTAIVVVQPALHFLPNGIIELGRQRYRFE